MKVESKINQYVGLKFYTGDGVNITERVNDGRTELFKDRKQANARALRLKSYAYPVNYTKTKKPQRPKAYGWGVPK